MIKFKRILCPTDLSMDSDQALRYALALRHAYEAALVVCYCANDKEAVDYKLSQRRIKNLVEHSLPSANLDWEGLVIQGEDVGEAIIQTAAEQAINLIVMRSRRRPHRAALLGSTAERVCRGAPCPVLVNHSDEFDRIDQATGRISLKRLLVAYDFSDYSELALNYAVSLAQEYQAELHLLHVLPPRTVNQPEIAWYPVGGETAYHKAARRLQNAIPQEAHLWCKIKHAVTEGHPYREVLNYAEKNEIDLISLGAHGAGFGMRALFGSNVDRVLRQAPCPVLVARLLKPAMAKNLQGAVAATKAVPRRVA